MGLLDKFIGKRTEQKQTSEGADAAEMSFIDHLEELRWHLIRIFLAIAVVGVTIFIYIKPFLETFVLAPFRKDFPTHAFICKYQPSLCFNEIQVDFIAIDPYEQFLMAFTVSFFGGIIVTFPYIVWELWRFIRPGLTPAERGTIRGNVFFISLLFFLGVLFAYYVIVPFSVSFLSGFKIADNVLNQWKIGKVIWLVTQVVMGGALMFQLPMVSYYLSKLGILTPRFMRSYRRFAIVILLIIAAIITPPDVVSQILVFLPLMLLYEISIIVSAVVERNAQKEE